MDEDTKTVVLIGGVVFVAILLAVYVAMNGSYEVAPSRVEQFAKMMLMRLFT